MGDLVSMAGTWSNWLSGSALVYRLPAACGWGLVMGWLTVEPWLVGVSGLVLMGGFKSLGGWFWDQVSWI